ncbi:hypothetical protein PMAYCL1PPCAC_19580, partial [Pristionchus mayeri]
RQEFLKRIIVLSSKDRERVEMLEKNLIHACFCLDHFTRKRKAISEVTDDEGMKTLHAVPTNFSSEYNRLSLVSAEPSEITWKTAIGPSICSICDKLAYRYFETP